MSFVEQILLLILVSQSLLIAGFLFVFIKINKTIKEHHIDRLPQLVEDLSRSVSELNPVSKMNDIPISVLFKEGIRRRMFIQELMETLIDVVAAGIGKAFKKR